jgi:DNA repair protein RecO (recombination protein O)
MIEKSRGMVLRTRPLTETSLIIHWLTPDLGRLAMVAKGARRPKSPFRGKLDLFYLADFSFVRSRASELHNLREVGLIETNSFLRQDLRGLQQASYAAALLEQTTEAETPLPGLYELFCNFLKFLATHPAVSLGLPAFELKLLEHLGLRPDLTNSRVQPGTRQLIVYLTESEWESLARVKLSATQASEIQQFLHGFLIYQFGRLPRATRVVRE